MDRKDLRALVVYAFFFTVFVAATFCVPLLDSFALTFFSVMSGAAVAIFLVFVFSANAAEQAVQPGWFLAGLLLNGVCKYIATRVNGYAVDNLTGTFLLGLGNLGLLMTAIGVGLLVARGLQKPNYLVMAAVVGAITDIFSVYHGPTKHMVGGTFFPYVMYHWGIPGMREVVPCVGAGDFVFLTLYFAGVRKFGLDDSKTFAAMVLAFAAGFLATLVSPNGIPALPFMSVALLLTHHRELKAKPAEA